MEEKTYEMLWDCEYCSAQKLLGVTHRFCPECGAAQNPQKRYFPPDDQKVRTSHAGSPEQGDPQGHHLPCIHWLLPG